MLNVRASPRARALRRSGQPERRVACALARRDRATACQRVQHHHHLLRQGLLVSSGSKRVVACARACGCAVCHVGLGALRASAAAEVGGSYTTLRRHHAPPPPPPPQRAVNKRVRPPSSREAAADREALRGRCGGRPATYICVRAGVFTHARSTIIMRCRKYNAHSATNNNNKNNAHKLAGAF